MPPASRTRRTFVASLRLLVIAVIVVVFISIPLRHRSHHHLIDGGRVGFLETSVVEELPRGDVHHQTDRGGASVAEEVVVTHSAPLETLPVLQYSFPSEATLDRLFVNGGATLNKTHVFPQQEEPTVEKSGKVFDRYHNPYLPLNLSSRPCRNGEHLKGRWAYDDSLQPLYPSYGEILGCCQRGFEKEKYYQLGAVRPELKYRWVTDTCDLHAWSEELFCKSLRGRDMMIAGDSLNDHWHASLYYLLGGRKDIYKREGTVRGKRACGTHEICHKYYPKPLRLYFLTNQLLQEERRLFRNYKWWKYIRGYPILILNAGSWMRDPADETRFVSDDEYFRHMVKAYAIVRRLYNGTVIWRTTYQGHPYCWRYTEPLTEELRPEDFPRVPPYLRYRWWAIPYRNNFTTQLWRDGGAHILDVSRVTNLMPLGHLGRNHPKYAVKNTTDCLHYCSPGPVYDTWSMLLMNLLLGNLEDNSVSRAMSSMHA